MNQSLTKSQEALQKVLQEAEEKRQALAKKLEERRTAVSRAENDMVDAAARENEEAYQRARLDRENSISSAELFENRLASIGSAPLIQQAEYEQRIAEVMSAIQDADKTAYKKLCALSEQMQRIGNDLSATIEQGNALMHQWQHDVFKDSAEMKNAAGKGIHIDSLEKQYREFSTVWWAGLAAERKPARKEDK